MNQFSCLFHGNQRKALREKFMSRTPDLPDDQKTAADIFVEYLSPLDLTYCRVEGGEWCRILQDVFKELSLKPVWLDSLGNVDNQWTLMQRKGQQYIERLWEGRNTDPCVLDPHTMLVGLERVEAPPPSAEDLPKAAPSSSS